MGPSILEPSQHDLPPSWRTWWPRRPPGTSGPLWAACGTSGAKSPLGKGLDLNWTLVFVKCAHFPFCWAVSWLTELPSTFLEFFSHKWESGVDKRRWFSPILSLYLQPSPGRGYTSDGYSPCFHAPCKLSSQCPGNAFPPWLVFSKAASLALDVISVALEVAVKISESHCWAVNVQIVKMLAPFRHGFFVP